MRVFACLFLLLAGASAYKLELAAGVSPVAKVIEMLQDMLQKSNEEAQDEKIRYAEFKQFCAGTAAAKTKSIEEADTVIGKVTAEIEDLQLEVDQLDADIKKADSDIEMLGKKIGDLAHQINDFNNEMMAEEDERKKEHEDFEKKDDDLSESVDALDRAITQVKTGMGEGAQAALLQVAQLDSVPSAAKKAVYSFLEQDHEVFLDTSSPEAAAYESQSDGIVDMFEELDKKIEDERDTGRRDEINRKNSYEMLMLQLKNQLAKSTDEKEDKTAQKAKRSRDLGRANSELADTARQRAEDKVYLEELNIECEQKAKDFAARQEMRNGEIDAVTKAIEIMKGDAANASGKHLEMVQRSTRARRQRVSMVQLRSSSKAMQREHGLQAQVAKFLAEQAESTSSKMLSLIASRAKDDPFGKVKKMIEDMVNKLMEEANEEAEHKGWCDTELGTNEHTRTTKSEDAESLKAEIDEMSAKLSKLSEDITNLNSAIATVDEALAQRTSEREAEKEKNEEAIADAKAAQTAVAQATSVLKEFFAKAAQSTAFVQTKKRAAPGEDAPETWDKPFTGSSDSSGVMGMLEVIQTDFARLETETSTSESESEKAFSQFSADSNKEKAVKSTSIKHKTTEKQETESSLAEAKKDLEGTTEELDAALAYFEKLKPSCMPKGPSYEERANRRKEELESLQEALQILSGNDIAV